MENFDYPFGHFLLYFLRAMLVIFEICHFLMIPGLFDYFSENECCQKIKVFLMNILSGVLWAVKS